MFRLLHGVYDEQSAFVCFATGPMVYVVATSPIDTRRLICDVLGMRADASVQVARPSPDHSAFLHDLDNVRPLCLFVVYTRLVLFHFVVVDLL